jgi:hypothetical protein
MQFFMFTKSGHVGEERREGIVNPFISIRNKRRDMSSERYAAL